MVIKNKIRNTIAGIGLVGLVAGCAPSNATTPWGTLADNIRYMQGGDMNDESRGVSSNQRLPENVIWDGKLYYPAPGYEWANPNGGPEDLDVKPIKKY